VVGTVALTPPPNRRDGLDELDTQGERRALETGDVDRGRRAIGEAETHPFERRLAQLRRCRWGGHRGCRLASRGWDSVPLEAILAPR
jgi:hypothetical protein